MNKKDKKEFVDEEDRTHILGGNIVVFEEDC